MQFQFDLCFTSVEDARRQFVVTAETPELQSPEPNRYTLTCGKDFFNVVDANVSRKEQLQFDISNKDGLVARSIGRNAAAFFIAGASEPSVPRSRDDTFVLKRSMSMVFISFLLVQVSTNT